MRIDETSIPDVKLISLRRFEDPRGYFSEIYNKSRLAEAGIVASFVQDNISVSNYRYTVRGIHFQTAPYVQGKLVQVLHGAVLDTFVDLRPTSPTFLKHATVELSADKWNQLWIPGGFGHAVCTLLPGTMLSYKVDAPYAPVHDAGIIWNDVDLAIQWPMSESEALLSDKDRKLPTLAAVRAKLPQFFAASSGDRRS